MLNGFVARLMGMRDATTRGADAAPGGIAPRQHAILPHMTDDEIRSFLPEFEALYCDSQAEAIRYACTTVVLKCENDGSIDAFHAWCIGTGQNYFLGFNALWETYEVFLFETGSSGMVRNQFRNKIHTITTKRSLSTKERADVSGRRVWRYEIKPRRKLRVAA